MSLLHPRSQQLQSRVLPSLHDDVEVASASPHGIALDDREGQREKAHAMRRSLRQIAAHPILWLLVGLIVGSVGTRLQMSCSGSDGSSSSHSPAEAAAVKVAVPEPMPSAFAALAAAPTPTSPPVDASALLSLVASPQTVLHFGASGASAPHDLGANWPTHQTPMPLQTFLSGGEQSMRPHKLSPEQASSAARTASPSTAVPSLHLLSGPLPFALRRNLILSCMMNYSLEAYIPFVESARANCATCTIMLVVFDHNRTPERQQFMDFFGAEFVDFDLPAEYTAPGVKQLDISSQRWIVMQRIVERLHTEGRAFEHALLVDGRDVIFQSNPFAPMAATGPGLYYSVESISQTLGGCVYNSAWYRNCFGQDELRLVSTEHISCSGSVAGSWEAMRFYLRLMERETMRPSAYCGVAGGSDQAIHNRIVYRLRDEFAEAGVALHAVSCETGWMCAIHWMQAVLPQNRWGAVTNELGVPYALLHQWDRRVETKALVQRKYIYLPQGSPGSRPCKKGERMVTNLC